jgi:hypothetical protein
MPQELTQGSRGAAVTALHEALTQIASDWSEPSINPQTTADEYVTSTAAAVAYFQWRLGIDVTYNLDDRTREQLATYHPASAHALNGGEAAPAGTPESDTAWRVLFSGDPWVRDYKLWYTLLNNSANPVAPNSIQTHFRMYDSNNIPMGNDIYANHPPEELRAGTSVQVEVEIPIPIMTEDGQYSLEVFLDTARKGEEKTWYLWVENERLVNVTTG